MDEQTDRAAMYRFGAQRELLEGRLNIFSLRIHICRPKFPGEGAYDAA